MAQNLDLRTVLMWCFSVVLITQPLCFSMDEGKQANSLERFQGRQREESLESSHGGISHQEVPIQAVIKAGAESVEPCAGALMWGAGYPFPSSLAFANREKKYQAWDSTMCATWCPEGLSTRRDSMIPCSFLRYRSIWEWSHQMCLGWSCGIVFLRGTRQFPLSS